MIDSGFIVEENASTGGAFHGHTCALGAIPRDAQLQGEMSRLFNGLLEGQGRTSQMDAAADRLGD